MQIALVIKYKASMIRPSRPYSTAGGKHVLHYVDKMNCFTVEFHNDLR